MPIKVKDLKTKLHERQYKLTPQREVILQVFVNHADKHLSAEDVYSLVKKEAPEIGMATVYRTIDLLSELEVLQKMDFGDGCSRYEISEDNTAHHHHHLICLNCGLVREFDDDLLETLENVISRKSNFQILDHQVKFYGYCQECQKKLSR